ncbi:MAG: hypothetical protein FJ405_04525 [Verrucomicrobia bacterium]|nr:hypothetical protein [Verrucomicrobiota bacterium]
MKHITPRSYLCFRASEPIHADGALNDRAWAAAAWSDPFVDIIGEGAARPRFRTRMKMLWDDEYLYIAAEMEEPHVWGTITQRDAVIFQDNDFEIFIDPDADSHRYAEFEINALNTLWDLFLERPYKDGVSARNEWDLPGILHGVQVQGSLNNPKDRDRGWTVEFALPWKSFSDITTQALPPNEGDQWRINFSRVEWKVRVEDGQYVKVPNRREDNWVWSPQGLVDMHRPEKWGYVQFTSFAPGKVRLVPDPSAYGRSYLHQAYYAQREFKSHYKRYAFTIDELGLDKEFNPRHLAWPLTLQHTADGYRATAEIRLPNGESQKWFIRQDGKVWSE